MDPEDVDTVARTVFGESRGESFNGKIAVANVVKNRWLDKRWPDTLAGVCTQKWQFSCWNENDPNRNKLLAVDLGNDVFRECYLAALLVLCEHTDDNTSGSNHYHTDTVNPPWSHGELPVCAIGHHKFFKL